MRFILRVSEGNNCDLLVFCCTASLTCLLQHKHISQPEHVPKTSAVTVL